MPRKALKTAPAVLGVLIVLNLVIVAFALRHTSLRAVLPLGLLIGCLDLIWVLRFRSDSILLDTILIGAVMLCQGVVPAALVRFLSLLTVAPMTLSRSVDPLLYASGAPLIMVAGFIYRTLGGHYGTLNSLPDLAAALGTAAILGLLTPLPHFAISGETTPGPLATLLNTFVLRVIRQNPFKYFVVGLLAILTALAVLYVSLPVGLAAGILLALVTQRQLSGARLVDRTYRKSLGLLMSIVEARDPYTRGHSERVAAYCVALGRQLGIPPWRWEAMYEAGLLHDLGKLVISEKILVKPGPLTEAEYRQVQQHAPAGAELLSGFGRGDGLAAAVRHHHEKYAGGGYPDGLVSGQIPLLSRIIAVADAFDAMTSTRSYRSALSVEQALGIIRGEAGRQFDPEVVSAAAVLQAGPEAAEELAVEVTGERPLSAERLLELNEVQELQSILEGLLASGMALCDPRIQELSARIDSAVAEQMEAKALVSVSAESD